MPKWEEEEEGEGQPLPQMFYAGLDAVPYSPTRVEEIGISRTRTASLTLSACRLRSVSLRQPFQIQQKWRRPSRQHPLRSLASGKCAFKNVHCKSLFTTTRNYTRKPLFTALHTVQFCKEVQRTPNVQAQMLQSGPRNHARL